jgi:hypothetical protein
MLPRGGLLVTSAAALPAGLLARAPAFYRCLVTTAEFTKGERQIVLVDWDPHPQRCL